MSVGFGTIHGCDTTSVIPPSGSGAMSMQATLVAAGYGLARKHRADAMGRSRFAAFKSPLIALPTSRRTVRSPWATKSTTYVAIRFACVRIILRLSRPPRMASGVLGRSLNSLRLIARRAISTTTQIQFELRRAIASVASANVYARLRAMQLTRSNGLSVASERRQRRERRV